MIYEKLIREAEGNLVDFQYGNTTILDGIKSSVNSAFTGAYTGLIAKPSTVLGGAMVSLSEQLDDLAGMDGDSSQTQFLRNSLVATVKQTQLMQEDVQNSGKLDSAIFSIGDVLGSFFGAGKFTKGIGATSATAGSIQGYSAYEQGLAEGLDKSSAMQKATIEGGATALGGYIPLTMGFKLSPVARAVLQNESRLTRSLSLASVGAQDIAYTAGANIAIGAGQRGFTHEILKANGYNQMAEQYQAIDDSAMLIDAAMGLIFGGVAKYAELRQNGTLDAMLAKNNQIHQNVDASIGIATDLQSLNAHDRAFNKALEDRINDRAVDVESILTESNFMAKNDIDWNNQVIDAIARQFPDEAMYYTKNGTPIPSKIINEVKTEITNKKTLSHQDRVDLASLGNGIIPTHLAGRIVEKTGLKASDIEQTLNIYDSPRTDTVTNQEFARMKDNAVPDNLTSPDAISQLLQQNPEMELRFTDDNGAEVSIKATELLESVNNEVELAKADKKLYEAAAACMLRNAR